MSIPCPRCINGTVAGPNRTYWRCHTCGGTGRLPDPGTDPVTWLNDERTVLVRRYSTGRLEVALRDEPDAIWGPPIPVNPETHYYRRERHEVRDDTG